MAGDTFTRRKFLRVAAGAAVAATGAACGSGSDRPKPSAASGRKGKRTLRIAQISHFVPAYDTWFDNEFAKRWGEEHDVEMLIDHIPITEQKARAAAEVAAGQGHDLFQFNGPPSLFEDNVIDHREVIDDLQARFGPMVPVAERSVFNPRTKKWLGVADHWIPGPVHYRTDLWAPTGRTPGTWEDLLAAGPELKRAGHPLGISMSDEPDGNWTLTSLLIAHGASLQDEGGNLSLDRPATVEAVKLGTAIYQAGMIDEVFRWDASSNNRFLASGQGSVIVNAISALRAIEDQDQDLASRIALLPPPAGPADQIGAYGLSSFIIWSFARNRSGAEQFLRDLIVAAPETFQRSRFFNMPSFPGAVPDLGDVIAADPLPQYGVLTDAADSWTNVGHPGYSNAAVDEVSEQYLIPKMFAAAASGKLSAEDAVKQASTQAAPIFDKWRERGKI